MTKPTLGKAWALFYVFQQLTKQEAAPILTQPLVLYANYRKYMCSIHSVFVVFVRE